MLKTIINYILLILNINLIDSQFSKVFLSLDKNNKQNNHNYN